MNRDSSRPADLPVLAHVEFEEMDAAGQSGLVNTTCVRQGAMKVKAILLAALATLIPPGSLAEEGWLLVAKTGHGVLVRADSARLHQVGTIGDRATFGDSATTIGVLALKENGLSELIVIDKARANVAAAWPVVGLPASQLSGPSRDVVLTRGSAYFLTVPSMEDGLIRNSAGGVFDFHRLSLSDGKATTLPLSARQRILSLDP